LATFGAAASVAVAAAKRVAVNDPAARSTRTILHVDMDAFFVSVELRRRPELRGLPVAVGGTAGRGVIAAASYEARRYGVRSAMPTATAQRACPNLVLLPGDHALYATVSEQVRAIFDGFTPLVEPLALDEAFLDVSGAGRALGSGSAIAAQIRRRTADELGLNCSIGVATNKFLAKLASVAAKPIADHSGVHPGPGVVEVLPGAELAFLHPLPVRALWGVGPATFERLSRLGVTTVADLAALERASLVASLGAAAGDHLHRLAWARDDRPVDPSRSLKSIGHEETFRHDRHTPAELRRELVRLADGVATRLRANGRAAQTLTIKVRFSGFHTITRSVTVASPIATAHAIVGALTPLLDGVDPTPGVRLLGVSASKLTQAGEQLSLNLDDPAGEPSAASWSQAEEVVDAIRGRFGSSSIAPASALDKRGVRVVRTGAQQWGPTGPPAR